jgi:sugar lactone lactonase YvrE
MRTLQQATLLLLAALISTQSLFAEGPTWRDSTRDVYVNGHLERTARVLSADAGKKTAVLLPGARRPPGSGLHLPLSR